MEFVEAVFYRKLTESDFKKMYKIEKPASGDMYPKSWTHIMN